MNITSIAFGPHITENEPNRKLQFFVRVLTDKPCTAMI